MARHVKHWRVEMVDPKPADIGRKVVYRDRRGWKVEEGVVRLSTIYVCLFATARDAGSKGTRREDLEWLEACPDPTASQPRNRCRCTNRQSRRRTLGETPEEVEKRK